jgi:tRNA threonylcarbamoyladenosine biosynthesis protein TsaE
MKQLKNVEQSQIKEVAKEISNELSASKFACFYGEMGSGKTTLIKKICEELGVKDEVSSPTFSLVNEYHSEDGKIIYHFDFYRIKDISEVYDIGFEEYFYSGNIVLVEWPELVEELLPEKFTKVEIELNGNDSRNYSII